MSAVGLSNLIVAGSPRSIVAVREDALFRTNLILANAGEASLEVDVTLIDEDGATLGTRRVGLPPLGMTQIGRLVRDMGMSRDVANARLLLSTSTVVGSFTAYAAVIDNTTNDPRTLLPRSVG